MSETVFKQVNYDLNSLVNYIELGEIGLPDIQRPFIWKNAKVRDLFDSMYKGYPVGYLLFWQNGLSEDARVIGTDTKQKPARLLIVDGQQRLTSLYAVLKRIKVIRENYDNELIKIAFNPLLEKFEVTDVAIERDKSYIPDISILWSKDTDLFEVVENYLSDLKASREVGAEDEKQIWWTRRLRAVRPRASRCQSGRRGCSGDGSAPEPFASAQALSGSVIGSVHAGSPAAPTHDRPLRPIAR